MFAHDQAGCLSCINVVLPSRTHARRTRLRLGWQNAHTHPQCDYDIMFVCVKCGNCASVRALSAGARIVAQPPEPTFAQWVRGIRRLAAVLLCRASNNSLPAHMRTHVPTHTHAHRLSHSARQQKTLQVCRNLFYMSQHLLRGRHVRSSLILSRARPSEKGSLTLLRRIQYMWRCVIYVKPFFCGVPVCVSAMLAHIWLVRWFYIHKYV